MKLKTQNSKLKNPPATALNVCVVTGTRAEFGIWRPVLRAIHQSPLLNLQLVATGMHLLPKFGDTIGDISRAGFSIAARAAMYKENESPANSLARGIENLAAAFRKLKPQIVLVLGDRLEMLAAASAALAERIPIAHVHGGESAPGIWDEQIRHAITKMSHLHFCATALAKRRILQMGENATHVHQVGAPALDAAVEFVRDTRSSTRRLRSFVGKSPLFLLHPSCADEELEYRRTIVLIDLLLEANDDRMFCAIGPNNDPGHHGILRAFRERQADLKLEMSLPQDHFWDQLLVSSVLVGNSSAGIIEAASFGIPVINIGDRQAGRERNANVIDVPWEADSRSLRRALVRATSDKAFLKKVDQRNNLYGDGKAARRIVTVLEKVARTGIPLEKRFAEVS